jgi:hypothetical protein
MRSDVLSALSVKIAAFWEMISCSLVEGTKTADEYSTSVFKVATQKMMASGSFEILVSIC